MKRKLWKSQVCPGPVVEREPYLKKGRWPFLVNWCLGQSWSPIELWQRLKVLTKTFSRKGHLRSRVRDNMCCQRNLSTSLKLSPPYLILGSLKGVISFECFCTRVSAFYSNRLKEPRDNVSFCGIIAGRDLGPFSKSNVTWSDGRYSDCVSLQYSQLVRLFFTLQKIY